MSKPKEVPIVRATVDTNVLVSGLLFGGLPYKVILAALTRKFVWVTSAILIAEAERVLCSRKFGLSQQEIRTLTTSVFEVAEIVVPVVAINAIERCPADNRVLECAIEGRCSAIVSGDRRDLLSLQSYKGVKILNPREFLTHVKLL